MCLVFHWQCSLSSGIMSSCRLRHFSSEKRDSSPTRDLSNRTSGVLSKKPCSGKTFVVDVDVSCSASLDKNGYLSECPMPSSGGWNVSVYEAKAASLEAELRSRLDTSPCIYAGYLILKISIVARYTQRQALLVSSQRLGNATRKTHVQALCLRVPFSPI